MQKTVRAFTAAILAVVLCLFAAIPVSAAERKKEMPCTIAAVVQEWSEILPQTLQDSKITRVTRLSEKEIEAISDRLSKKSKVYLVELSDGRYTYYMAVDFRADDAEYLRNLGVMRKTSRKLYDRSEKMAKKNAKKSPVLMDYTHIVGELGVHFFVYCVTDSLGGDSLKGVLGKAYRTAAVADLNIDESRMQVLIRILGLLIGE